MTDPFRTVHHVCIVVSDIEAAVRFYESISISGWQEYPPLVDYTDLNVPDNDAFFAMKYKYTDAPGLQLQLCEPNDGPSPQRKFLDRTGDGVFHIGFVVDDVDDATEQVHSLGMKTWMYGRRGNRTGFTYFRTPEIAGVTLEVRQSPTS